MGEGPARRREDALGGDGQGLAILGNHKNRRLGPFSSLGERSFEYVGINTFGRNFVAPIGYLTSNRIFLAVTVNSIGLLDRLPGGADSLDRMDSRTVNLARLALRWRIRGVR